MILSASVSATAETFSLKQSIAYGLKHSPQLQGQNLRIDQAGMDIKAQRGRFLPSVSTGYSHSRLYSQYTSGTVDTDYIDQKNTVGSLSITQPLFAGFENKNRFDRAKLGKSYQKTQMKLQQLDLVYQIKAVFFELLKTRYDVTDINQRIKRLDSDLAAAKAFSDQKIAAYVYVLQAEANLEEAKQSLWQTQTAIYRHTAGLYRLLGLSGNPETDIKFDDEFGVPVHELVLDITHCVDLALANRPEIMLLTLQMQMAEKDAAIALGRYYPRITLNAGLYDTDRGYDKTSSYSQDQHNTYWSAGLSVQMNLFDGGSAYYENSRHRLEIRRINTQMQQIKMELKEAVGVALKSLMETRNRLSSVEKSLLVSRENYERQRKRFTARIGTTSEVLDAQTMLTRAESGKSQALLDYQMALAALYHAMGQKGPLERVQVK